MKIIFLGSSVTYGDDGYSMCEYIRETTGYDVVKWAVSGTTLADISDESYVSRLQQQIDTQDNCDCFVCQLSTNDASNDIPLGKIGDTKLISDFDVLTVTGAIEYIITRVREKWNCPVVFYTGTYMEKKNYPEMVDALLKLKEKWHFEIIDLWNDPQMRAVNPEDYKLYMNNPTHPSKLGYQKWWGPKFVEGLNRILCK